MRESIAPDELLRFVGNQDTAVVAFFQSVRRLISQGLRGTSQISTLYGESVDIELLRTFGAPLLSAVVGGLLVHFGARRRDKANDRRRQRIDYLVEAYRALARSSHRQLSGKQREEFENAVDDVLLFGDHEQIELSRQMIASFAANGTASLDTLLVSLGRALRRELGQLPNSLSAVPSIRIASRELDVEAPLLNDSAEVRFQSEAARTAQALLETAIPIHTSNRDLTALVGELDDREPLDAIGAGYALVFDALRSKIPDGKHAQLDDVQLSVLAKVAASSGLVGEAFVRTAEGLDVLKALSHDGSDSMITSQHAQEYLNLVSAALYVIAVPG